jgi:hypothetical protein
MMKMIALAAAMLISSAAVAQTTPETPLAPPSDMAAPTAPAEPASPSADPAMPAAVPSAPSAAAPVAQTNYPRCSATVTDQCRQNSARESDRKGGPRKRRG